MTSPAERTLQLDEARRTMTNPYQMPPSATVIDVPLRIVPTFRTLTLWNLGLILFSGAAGLALGLALGGLLGSLIPDYYSFAVSDEISPLLAAMLLGGTQGLGAGVGVGLVLAVAHLWYRTRMFRYWLVYGDTRSQAHRVHPTSPNTPHSATTPQ